MSGIVAVDSVDEGWGDDGFFLWPTMGFLPWALAYAIRYILSGEKTLSVVVNKIRTVI